MAARVQGTESSFVALRNLFTSMTIDGRAIKTPFRNGEMTSKAMLSCSQ
jgi:hypothetical protein